MAKINKYVSDLTIRLGPIQTTGALLGVRKSAKKAGKPQMKYVSPEGRDVEQRYVDAEGNVFKVEQLEKAAVVKDSTDEDVALKVSKAAVEEAKASKLPKNVVNLTVHDAVDVERELYPSDANAYVFLPDDDDPANVQWYELLVKLVGESDRAFVSVANIRNHEGLYRLTTWRGRLVLQRHLYPSEVNDHQALDTGVEIDKATLGKARKMVDKLAVPFDADEYRDSVAERLAEVQRAFQAGEREFVAPEPEPEAKGIDLSAALDAFGEM